MKKLTLLFIITIIGGSQLFSQTYRKLVEEGKIWSTVIEMVDDLSTYWITFGTDTIINGETYKRVLESDNQTMDPSYRFGFIREDTTKKVYFRNNSDYEGLLYDFGANIGDTILIVNTFSWNCLDDLTAVVDTIFYSNIITIINNCPSLPAQYNTSLKDYSERKIIIVKKLDSEDQLDYWIEGIGSISGVLESGSHFMNCEICSWYITNYLLCHFENSVQVYGLDELSNLCHLQVENNNVEINNLSIFPNPVVGNTFTVEFESPFTGNIAIHNTLGNMILKKTVNAHATSITINLPNIPSGLYFLIATDFYGNTNTSKIIIN